MGGPLIEENVKSVCCFPADGLDDMGVCPKRGLDTAVTEYLLHNLGIDALLKG